MYTAEMEEALDFETEWARCTGWVQSALDAGGNTHTLADVAQAVLSGRMQFWPAPEGCAITEIVVYPRSKCLHIFLAGGELEQIVDMNSSAAAFAQAMGCTGMSISGRRGWVKVLKNHGWEESQTVLVKELK